MGKPKNLKWTEADPAQSDEEGEHDDDDEDGDPEQEVVIGDPADGDLLWDVGCSFALMSFTEFVMKVDAEIEGESVATAEEGHPLGDEFEEGQGA